MVGCDGLWVIRIRFRWVKGRYGNLMVGWDGLGWLKVGCEGLWLVGII